MHRTATDIELNGNRINGNESKYVVLEAARCTNNTHTHTQYARSQTTVYVRVTVICHNLIICVSAGADSFIE